MGRRWWSKAVAGAVIGFALLMPARAQATYLDDAGWGTLAVLTNLVYAPAKVAYAVVGGITGGLAYAVTAGDMETAETIWTTSLGGTYVITPRMLRGADIIAFSGVPEEPSHAGESRIAAERL